MRRKFWTTFLIALICFSALFAFGGRYVLNRDLGASRGEGEDKDDNLELDETSKDKDEILVLLMGIDDEQTTSAVQKLKEKRKKTEERYITTGHRSDTMILCRFNFETGEITMVSIPRDTRTNIRGRKSQERINHAHSYGGPYLSIDAVKDLLNIDLEYYVTVDYLAVKEIVEAIGGVDIDVPRDMKYKDVLAKPPLIINVKKGQQRLNGDKSLEYLRFRSYPDGDLGRVKAQQLFIKEFVKQVLKPKNIIRLPKIAKTYFDYVDTNIPINLVMKSIGNIKKIDMDNIKMTRLPGDGKYIGGVSYFIYDEKATKELVEEVFSDFLLSK
jgi:LCP family protein required for cell wall assembly